LFGSSSEYTIGEGYSILYNKRSNKGANRFLLSIVHDTTIECPIIFVNYEKRNINIKDIEEILKREVNQFIYEI